MTMKVVTFEVNEWEDKNSSLLDAVYQLQCLARMNYIYYELRLSKYRLFHFGWKLR